MTLLKQIGPPFYQVFLRAPFSGHRSCSIVVLIIHYLYRRRLGIKTFAGDCVGFNHEIRGNEETAKNSGGYGPFRVLDKQLRHEILTGQLLCNGSRRYVP